MIHLFPANGISDIAYTELIKFLSPHSVTSFTYPPLEDRDLQIPSPLNWNYFDQGIDKQFTSLTNGIGIGHSLGGTLLLNNALKNPSRWKIIFIVEPALFSKWINMTYKFVRFLKLEDFTHPMIRVTKPRREFFDSKETTFKRWRNRHVFSFLSDASLKYYIDASLIECAKGYQLRFPKNWECEIYRNMCSLDPFIWENLPNLKSNLIVIGGESSNTFFESARRRLKKQSVDFIAIPNTSHLLPFETPLALSRIILKHL